MVADYEKGYSLTLAPLAIGNKILVGPAGGELGIRGFIAAYDAKTGQGTLAVQHHSRARRARARDVDGDAWKHGGASVWLTGSYDPELNLTYWGIGNPGPDWNPDSGPATTSTPIRWWRSTPTPAN